MLILSRLSISRHSALGENVRQKRRQGLCVRKSFVKSKTLFRFLDANRCAAAEDGGGAAPEGGRHEEDPRVPGRGGHQGTIPKMSTSIEVYSKSSQAPPARFPN